MTTIKLYTDLKQSEKLMEFLPLESADMCYPLPCEDRDIPLLEQGGLGSTPCWSLAVLIEEIPEIINFDDDESDYALEILKEGGLYYLSYGNLLEHNKIEIEPQEYFVDACYEMILKLHEQNLL